MEAVVQGTVNALGFLENGLYHQEPDCYESLRDIIRFLRNDTAEFLARRICGDHNIIENDLIPILKSSAEKKDEKMFDITLRLMINLAQPAIVSFQGKAPDDVQKWQYFSQLEANLQRAKLAFADVEFFRMLSDKLRSYFVETEKDDQIEEQRMVMERIIVLIRYIFSIGQSQMDGKRTVNEVNSTDKVISAFLDSSIQEVFIHVASQTRERDFHLAILEIFAMIFREYKPSDLIITNTELTLKEKTENEIALRQALEVEEAKRANKRWSMGMRHSRFAGTYVTKGGSLNSPGNNLVIMKPIKNANDLSFLDERKTKKRIARNRRPFEVTQKVHTSSVELRMKLKSFVEEILEKAFNRLMKHTWDLAFGARRAVGQRNSDMHYFQFMKFCMEYCRLAELNSSLIDNCIGTEAFHQVQVQIIDNFDLALSNKSEAKFYGMRAQYALSAYKELLLTHQHLLEKGNSEDRRIASAAVSHIQNVEEYRELALDILRKFAPGAFSKNFLRELLLANHYYLRILERSVKTGRLQKVKRREKIKKKAKRKPRAAKSEKSGGDAISAKVDKMAQDKLDSLWDEAVNESLTGVVNGTVEYSKDQIVLNALLEVEDEEHQRFAMLRIQRALREKRPDDAVGLYRAARQIWNTDGVFGTDDMTVEAEINELREIFNADLMEVAKSFKKINEAMEQHYKDTVEAEEKENQENQEENPEEDYYDEEEEEEPRYETKEIDFDLSDHISKYSKSDILKWYVFILDEFDRNTPELNKAVVKMLHRIAFDLRMPIKLFQLSLFRIFNRIGEHFANVKPEDRKKRSFFEVYEFGHHLLKKFFQMMDEIGSTKMGLEVLFWKETRDCIEIEYGDDEKGADKNEENPDEPKKPKEKRKTKEKRQKSPKKPRAKRRKVDPWEDGSENENEKDEVEADFLDLADQPSQDLLEDGLHINTTLDESTQDTSRLRLETPSPDSSQDPDRFRLPSLSPGSSQNSTRLRIASSSPDSLRQTSPMPENNPENQQEENYSDKENAAINSDDDDGGAVKVRRKRRAVVMSDDEEE